MPSIQTVRCTDKQWGNETMRRIAEKVLSGENPPDVVDVHEHGGWWLMFAYIGGNLEIVGTANDQARFGEEVREFWRAMHRDCPHSTEHAHGRCNVEYRLPWIELPEVA